MVKVMRSERLVRNAMGRFPVFGAVVCLVCFLVTISSEKCDPGSNPESCFDIVKSNLTFLDANVECTKRGKFLLTIYSKKQLKTVSARLKKEIGTSVDVWFGLYITFDRYQWISGSPVVVNTFLTPVPAPNNAHCFSMRGGDSLDTWTPRYCNVKLWFLCGAKPHVLPKSPSPSFPKNLGCPNNYKLFGTRCYLSKLELVDALTWDDAANFCSKLTANGSLATISSFAEQDYLSIMVARSSGPVWIGLQSLDGEHRWNDSSDVTFTNWMRMQPTGGEQRRCSVIHQRPRDLGEWENVNCSAKLGFVCQAAALVVPQPTNTGLSLLSNRGRCLPEFFEYNRRCYRLLTQLSDAGIKNNLDGTNCQTRIAPHSPEELVLMRLMMRTASSLPEFSWIGVNFSYNSTLSPTKSKIQFSVEDGLPVTLGAALNFYDDQLMQTLKGHENSANYCVAIGRDVAGLSLMNCSTQLPSICGYSMHDYELQPTTTSTSCPSTWKRLGDVCYSDFRYPPRTWSDAESNCQSLDPKAHLVSLHTPTQQSYLSRLLQHRRAWLGLRVQLQTNANRTRIYTWSDESPVDYLSFGVGEPSFGLSNGDVEECVVLQDETHDWNDVHCYDRYPFVCQLTLSPSVDQTSVSTTLIPQDPLQQFCFKDDSSFCVELHQTPLTFWDAETMCQSRNLTLVTVPSKGHHKFVMTFLPEHESAFIGLFASNGQWLWTSAYPSLSATFWSKNHPFGKDLCVFVEKSEDELYTWKAGPCDQPMPYFCATRPTLPVLKSVDLTKYTCPSNYTRIGPSCYLVKAGLEDKATWTEALNLCALTASGAGLATISSIQEQNELIALLGLQFKSAWIGLQLVDDVHTWQRGDPVIYTNWARDQPSGHGMRCTLLQFRFDHLGEWNEEECYQRHGYVCQASPLPTSIATDSPPSQLFKTGLCVSGYYEYRNQCFSVLPYIPQSHRSAFELHDEVSGQCARMTHATGTNCADKQNNWWGTLTCPVVASPHTVADAAFVRALLGTFGMSVKNAWIGLKLVSNKTTVQVVSEDGVTLGASHLLASKPQLLSVDIMSNTSVTFHCLTISTLSNNLEVVDCSMTGLPAICSYYLADHPLRPKARAFHTTNCPSGWTPFGGKCFSVTSVNTQLNWSDAEQACQASGKDVPMSRDFQLIGHLASIHSLEEQHVVYEMASSSSIWIGLQAFYAPVPTHSFTAIQSESTTSSVQLAWSDDSSVDYLALSSTHAYLDVGPSVCFAIVSGDGSSWQATECHQQRSFVCQLSPIDPMDTLVSRSANPVQSDGPPLPCNSDIPLATRSNSACYRLFFSMVDWAGAEGICRNLGSDVHLASIHSKSEFDELIELLRNNSAGSQDVWFGLHESEFAYAWSDGTSTDFISLSADLSKDYRHLRQDCFVLSPSAVDRSTMNWKAVDCAGPRPALICQRGGRAHTSLATVPDPSNWKLVLCPPGYRQFADRCFSLLPKPLSWNDANNECSLNAKQFRGYFGSLARIDSSFVQDFVASLLDDLTPPSSSAWIGLQRDFSEGTPNIRWADASQTRYLRSIFRTHQEPIYNLKSIRSIQADEIHLKMCTAVYRSTLPRLNGLWLQWACDQVILLPSICQAIPPDGMNLDGTGLTPVSAACPSEFFLGTTGFASSGSSSANIVQPVCYRLLSQTEKLDWQTSSRRCQTLSSRENNVSLLSIASVFEASFLRSWLRLPRALGGAGLSADEPVWSALSVSKDCPNCFWNWTWDTIDREPVRYTDWLVSPSPNPSGCYVFEPNAYKRADFKADQGLGSLRPSASCAHTYFAVCQTLAKPTDSRVDLNLAVTASHGAPTTHQPVRQQCFNFLNSHAADYYLENVTVSRDGKPCIRWDLVPTNITEFHLESSWMRSRLQAAESVGGEGNPSYAENFCSTVSDAATKSFNYGCYVHLKPLQFEACHLSRCPTVTLSRVPLLGPLTITLLLLFIVLCIGLLGVALWRGYAPLHAGYRRYFTPVRFRSNRMRRSSVQFIPPDKLAYEHRLDGEPDSGLTRSCLSHSNGLLSAVDNDKQAGSIYVPDPPQIQNQGYTNPIYNSLTVSVPEDDYDPEAEL